MARDIVQFEKIIPEHNILNDHTGQLQDFLNSVLQVALNEVLAEVDRLPDTFDPDTATNAFIDAMLLDLGNPFNVDLTLNKKRKLVRTLIDIYRDKGTEAGVENVIRFLTGVDVMVVAPSTSSAWVLGVDILDPDGGVISAILGPSASFTRFSFDVQTDAPIPSELQETIRQIVLFMKPAATHFVNFVTVTGPTLGQEWVLDVSELGEDSVLGEGDQT